MYFEIVNKKKIRKEDIKFVKCFNKSFAIEVINFKFIFDKM